MTTTKNSAAQPHRASLGKRMLVGAWIGLLLISFFLFSAGEPNPAWGRLWTIRPLIIVPLAGAAGGASSYFIAQFHDRVGVNRIVAAILSVIIFIIGLWIGTILGLDGTMWN